MEHMLFWSTNYIYIFKKKGDQKDNLVLSSWFLHDCTAGSQFKSLLSYEPIPELYINMNPTHGAKHGLISSLSNVELRMEQFFPPFLGKQ